MCESAAAASKSPGWAPPCSHPSSPRCPYLYHPPLYHPPSRLLEDRDPLDQRHLLTPPCVPPLAAAAAVDVAGRGVGER